VIAMHINGRAPIVERDDLADVRNVTLAIADAQRTVDGRRSGPLLRRKAPGGLTGCGRQAATPVGRCAGRSHPG
jgi:hypothetical protein